MLAWLAGEPPEPSNDVADDPVERPRDRGSGQELNTGGCPAYG